MSRAVKNEIYMLARFDSPHDLIEAARKVRRSGYEKFDCHSPFPIHGMDEVMGLKRSPIGYIVGFSGLAGMVGSMLLQWWSSAVEYPLVISGKPFFSWQAFIPVSFALTVLMSAFGAFFGMLAFNRLPQFFHTLFDSDKFEAMSNDGFFISIASGDARFDEQGTREMFESIGGKDVETVGER